jgi:membrane protease YdiL (CAAX protease family)
MSTSQVNTKKKLKLELLIIIACTLLGVVILMLLSRVLPLGIFTVENPYHSIYILLLILFQNAVIFAPIYILAIRKRKLKLADFGFRKTKVPRSFGYILATFFIFFTVMLSITYVQELYNITLPGFGEQINKVTLFGTGTLNQVIGFITIVLIAPFIEEVLFRGYFYETLRKIIPKSLAIIIGVPLLVVVIV